MTSASTRQHRDVTWAAERFFFAKLDTSRLPKSRTSRENALRFLFESELPLPVEEVHAVFVPLHEDLVLAVGVGKHELRARAKEGGELQQAVTLRPESFPEWLEVDPGVLPKVNLLVSEFAPRAVTAARRTRGSIALLAFTLVVALFVLGVERRISRIDSDLETLNTREEKALVLVLGTSPTMASVPTVQRIAAVVGEKRKLERTRGSDASNKAEVLDDVAPRLGSILVAWPSQKDVEVDVRSLSITASLLVIRGEGKDAAACQLLCDALSKVDQLTIDQPQVSAGAESGKVEFEVRARTKVEKQKATPSSQASGTGATSEGGR